MKKDKIPFDSYEAAQMEIERILNTNFNVCKKVKPCRCYLSSDGFGYLT